MKLIFVLGVQGCEKDIRSLFDAARIGIYSEIPVTGHKRSIEEDERDNWFGVRSMDIDSVACFAFAPAGKVDALLSQVEAYNSSHPSQYPLHAYSLLVDKTV